MRLFLGLKRLLPLRTLFRQILARYFKPGRLLLLRRLLLGHCAPLLLQHGPLDFELLGLLGRQLFRFRHLQFRPLVELDLDF
jgi:hypothetical protein